MCKRRRPAALHLFVYNKLAMPGQSCAHALKALQPAHLHPPELLGKPRIKRVNGVGPVAPFVLFRLQAVCGLLRKLWELYI